MLLPFLDVSMVLGRSKRDFSAVITNPLQSDTDQLETKTDAEYLRHAIEPITCKFAGPYED